MNLKSCILGPSLDLPQDLGQLDHSIITSVPVEVLKVPPARISRCSCALSADLGIEPVGPAYKNISIDTTLGTNCKKFYFSSSRHVHSKQ